MGLGHSDCVPPFYSKWAERVFSVVLLLLRAFSHLHHGKASKNRIPVCSVTVHSASITNSDKLGCCHVGGGVVIRARMSLCRSGWPSVFSVTNFGPTSTQRIVILLSSWGQAMECGSLTITVPGNLTVSSSIVKCGLLE